AAGERDIAGSRLENVGGDAFRLGDDGFRAAAHHVACHAHRAAGMRSAADRDDVGVVLEYANVFEAYAEPVRYALGVARLVALARRQGADVDVDPALGIDDHLGPFARLAHRDLDVVPDADAAQLASGTGLGL